MGEKGKFQFLHESGMFDSWIWWCTHKT